MAPPSSSVLFSAIPWVASGSSMFLFSDRRSPVCLSTDSAPPSMPTQSKMPESSGRSVCQCWQPILRSCGRAAALAVVDAD
eukprot:7114597-Alexandrium_andersonii.AAC.1